MPWALVITAALAAAAPDLDGIAKHLVHIAPLSPYGHRGAAHSLFAAIAAGLLAAAFHKRLGVQPLTAGLVIAAAMASHGLLDMMTDRGLPVAYFWPLSSTRFFAVWRPLYSTPVHMAHLVNDILVRLGIELWQLIIPMFAVALAIRGIRLAWAR